MQCRCFWAGMILLLDFVIVNCWRTQSGFLFHHGVSPRSASWPLNRERDKESSSHTLGVMLARSHLSHFSFVVAFCNLPYLYLHRQTLGFPGWVDLVKGGKPGLIELGVYGESWAGLG